MDGVMEDPVAPKAKKKRVKAKRPAGSATPEKGIHVHVNVSNHSSGHEGGHKRSGNTADDALSRLRGY